MLTISTNKNLLSNALIVDFTYSYHMCLNSDGFYTYKSCKYETILMANDATYKFVEIGIIKLECLKNLISLWLLNALGCNSTTKDGKLKVVKEALIILKDEEIENLCYLVSNINYIGLLSLNRFCCASHGM